MISKMHYPDIVFDGRQFDPTFAIRGLAVDKKHGVLVKLSHLLDIEQPNVHLGRKQCSPEQVAEYYGHDLHITPEYRDKRIRPLNDQFSLVGDNSVRAPPLYQQNMLQDSVLRLFVSLSVCCLFDLSLSVCLSVCPPTCLCVSLSLLLVVLFLYRRFKLLTYGCKLNIDDVTSHSTTHSTGGRVFDCRRNAVVD